MSDASAWLWLPLALALALLSWNSARLSEWFTRNSVDGTVFEPGPRTRRGWWIWNRWLGRGFAIFLLAMTAATILAAVR